MLKRVLTIILSLGLLVGVYRVSNGQAASELLQNPSFESYYGVGGANTVPLGWKLTSNPQVGSGRHVDATQCRTGACWEISGGDEVFTAVAYQQVNGMTAGTKLHFLAFSSLFTCNKQDSCIENGLSYRVSDKSSGAQARIGADPNGGTDPNAASVVWSPFISSFDAFTEVDLDFTAASTTVTVFLYDTQSAQMLLNRAYWDDASLQAGGSGGTGGPAGSTVQPTAPQFAPVVHPQATQPDGSIIHIVGAGDTLSSIAVAYKVTVDQIRKLNNIAPDVSLLQIGQKLIIRGPTATDTPVATASADLPTATIPMLSPYTMSPDDLATMSMLDLVPTLTDTPAASPEVSDTQQPAETIAATPSTSTSTVTDSVCINAFVDSNSNRILDSGEKSLAGVTVSLSKGDQVMKSTVTTATGQTCFKNFDAGTYIAAVAAPAGYKLTTTGQIEIDVRKGTDLVLSFGFMPTVSSSAGSADMPVAVDQISANNFTMIGDNRSDDQAAPVFVTQSETSYTAPSTSSSSDSTTLPVAAGVILVGFVGMGIGAFVLLKKR